MLKKTQDQTRKKFLIAALVILIFGASSCGKKSFDAVSSVESQKAPGNFTVPPRVDILLAQDDTPSILEPFSQLKAQVPEFLNKLQNSGWDYHFATIPLTTDRPLTEVLASKNDGNWGAEWIPGYPGVNQFAPGTIAPNFFRKPSEYHGFDSVGVTGPGESDPAFITMTLALSNRVQDSNFLRPDALLVLVVVSNGNDGSEVTYVPRGTQDPIMIATPESDQTSFEKYKAKFLSYKNNEPSLVRFYSVVGLGYGPCLGGRTYYGTRYINMANALQGQSYNLCSQAMSQTLDGMSNNLRSFKIQLRTRFLIIGSEPNMSAPIKVIRYVNGDRNHAVEIPEDRNNGWTYVGRVNQVYTIDSPVPMDLASGYALELHGSAKLISDDKADVQFTPAQINPSTR